MRDPPDREESPGRGGRGRRDVGRHGTFGENSVGPGPFVSFAVEPSAHSMEPRRFLAAVSIAGFVVDGGPLRPVPFLLPRLRRDQSWQFPHGFFLCGVSTVQPPM